LKRGDPTPLGNNGGVQSKLGHTAGCSQQLLQDKPSSSAFKHRRGLSAPTVRPTRVLWRPPSVGAQHSVGSSRSPEVCKRCFPRAIIFLGGSFNEEKFCPRWGGPTYFLGGATQGGAKNVSLP